MTLALRTMADPMRSMVSGVMIDSKRLAPDRMTYSALSKSKEGTVPNVAE